jgi:hypothetical protein
MCGATQTVDLEQLDDALRLAPVPSSRLFRKIMGGCTRLSLLRQAGKAAWIDRLIEAGAWTDAAFALIEFELPAWTVRRVVHESGEWLCSLSRQSNLPIDLDDMADGRHEVLPLAILLAFVDARHKSSAATKAVSTVPSIPASAEQIICCDNFA